MYRRYTLTTYDAKVVRRVRLWYGRTMNEQVRLISQITTHLQAATEGLRALAKTLQTDDTPPVLTLSDEDPRVSRLYSLAKAKIVRADGEWVSWRDLRPAYRDRDQYAERLWSSLAADPEVQTRTSYVKGGLRREARYDPII